MWANLTRNLPLAVLEKTDALPAPEGLAGVFGESERSEASQLLARYRDGLISDVEAANAIGAMSYRNGLRDAPPRNGKQAAWMCPENPDPKHAFSWATEACALLPPLTCRCCGKKMIRVWVSTGF